MFCLVKGRKSLQTITLEIKNIEDVEILLNLVKKLDAKIISSSNKTTIPKKKATLKAAFLHLDKIAKKGNLKELIPDPLSWQKQLRKDRKLPGR